jgi:hypothetical protein
MPQNDTAFSMRINPTGNMAELGQAPPSISSNNVRFAPINLWAEAAGGASTMVTVNELRLAVQIQRLFERDARGGTRYTEMIRSHFGVDSPDSRLQRPEYLGGRHVPIECCQVLQTSDTSLSPLGETGAYSKTCDYHDVYKKSFTEHGYILGLASVRVKHTYQNGCDRMFFRRNRFDYYMPVLAHIPEQPVFNREIFVTGALQDNETFGFQEAWAEYRYKPSRISGDMRSASPRTLDPWHYSYNFQSLPTLHDDFIREPISNIDRTLVLDHTQSMQFFADFYFKTKATRPMPVYSMPGMMDHF